jgi:hypothetical protein
MPDDYINFMASGGDDDDNGGGAGCLSVLFIIAIIVGIFWLIGR